MTERTSIRNALPPGHVLSWYKVERILGEGSFGITYLARDDNLGRQVAIKEFLPVQFAERAEDDSVRPLSNDHEEPFQWGLRSFISEAQTIARFQHPNIIHVYAVFEANGTAYMVMQYERGQTLQSMLGPRRTLEQGELAAILAPVLDGLEVVHRSGFVHRDIKPDNIILRKDGSPVLIDFGSARQALEERTQPLTILISPGYTPLEQYSSNADAQGPWTDIYSLAATLYRCVTGKTPANAIDRSDGVRRKNRDSLQPAAQVAQGRYDQAFLAAIDHGLAFHAEERPQSVAQWRQEFGNLGATGQTRIPTLSPLGVVPEQTAPPAEPGGPQASFQAESPPSPRVAEPPPQPPAHPAPGGDPLPSHPASHASGASPPGAASEDPDRGDQAADVPDEAAATRVVAAADAPVVDPSGIHLSKAFGRFGTLSTDTTVPPRGPPTERRTGWQALRRLATARAEDDTTGGRSLEPRALWIAGALSAGLVLTMSITWMLHGHEEAVGKGAAQVSGGGAGAAPEADVAREDRTPTSEDTGTPNVETLLARAETAMQDLRLTVPAEDNAFYYYRKVFALDPGNLQAAKGLRDITRRYAALAREQMDQADLTQASTYVRRGLQVQPDDPELRHLEKDIGTAIEAARAERTESARSAGGDSLGRRIVEALKRIFSGSDVDATPPPRPDR